jgi:hypothetical protein
VPALHEPRAQRDRRESVPGIAEGGE